MTTSSNALCARCHVEPRDPNSTKGYCKTCRQSARTAVREQMAADREAREQRYAEFEVLYARASEAAELAAEECVPTPMTVVRHANPLDDNSPIVERFAPVADGVCGFAEVVVRPGNSSFARWAAKTHGWRKSYPSGMALWVSDYGQSYERKRAYASAFARVLREAGIQATVSARLD